jgi:hypothetical protein
MHEVPNIKLQHLKLTFNICFGHLDESHFLLFNLPCPNLFVIYFPEFSLFLSLISLTHSSEG